MKLPCLITKDSKFVLLRNYHETGVGYVVLYIGSDTYVKGDKRIKGDIKTATETFKKLYGYQAEFVEKELKNLL